MNSATNSITVERLGTTVTIQRRTVLSDARYRALLARVAPHLEAIATAVNEGSEVVDFALTKYCRLVSQVTGGERLPVAFVTLADDGEQIQAKCVAYLIEVNPELLEAWDGGLQEIDATWNAPELTPNPPEKLTKNA